MYLQQGAIFIVNYKVLHISTTTNLPECLWKRTIIILCEMGFSHVGNRSEMKLIGDFGRMKISNNGK